MAFAISYTIYLGKVRILVSPETYNSSCSLRLYTECGIGIWGNHPMFPVGILREH